ncbi:hypothetical protein XENOCAPTIV_021051 [Xenoophorus captivus]|uniref:Uncharacterized protein n=1 Tax=Xenoophorus captivus TaxID=1517983 RepID=A0ABV0R1M9_9TELE
MSHSSSTFPPCLSAAACPPCTVTPFSSPTASFPPAASGLPVGPSDSCLFARFVLLSWGGVCFLSGCINIYLSPCSMSPVNTLLSLLSLPTPGVFCSSRKSVFQHHCCCSLFGAGCVFEAGMTGDLGFELKQLLN